MSVGPGATELTRMFGGEFARPGAGEAEHARLGGAVERKILAAEIGELGADVDDASALALLDHQADGFPADQEGAAQIDADDLVEVVKRAVEQTAFQEDASIVHEDVQPADSLPTCC